MNATQQHMLDAYRATRLGAPVPPAPGLNDWQAVREVRDYWRFRAVVEGRPPLARRLRIALTHLLALRDLAARGSAPRPRAARARPAGPGAPRACG
ncbi:hypothetical protein [Streptomyces sp. Wb2n-11]|uniref:hypothetical protein n=1 Tax=Streptomyces sp. Wb2n-11 TaxID=1030533 RepID=UPI000AE409AB|nr:hypothetical protein [Streptomyces sp. Wb2n-11]